MKKTFCDRCKKEMDENGVIITEDYIYLLKIKKIEVPKTGSFANPDPDPIDLCEECHAAVYNFIFNNKEEPTE